MSRLYDALKNAQESLPAAAPARVRRAQPMVEDAPVLRLSQAIDTRLADRPQRVVQIIACGSSEDAATAAKRLAALSAISLRRSVLLLDETLPPVPTRSQPAHPAVAGLPPVPALEPAIAFRADSGLPYTIGSLSDLPEASSVDPRSLQNAWDRLRDHYELVVVSSSSVDSPLALAISPTVDGVVLVVEADRTRMARAEAARDALIGGGANVLGVILDKHRHWVPKRLWDLG